MPPFAHTKPCGVSVMTTPLSIRTTRRASRRTTSTWRASRSQRSANSIASGRGSIVVRSTMAPSAFDTTFWVTTRTSSSRSGRTAGGRRERIRDERRQVVARDDLAEALERDRLDAVSHRRPRASSASASSRSSGVSMSSVSGPSSTSTCAPAAVAAPAWADRLSPPKQNSMTSGGDRRSAFVPRPWRSGTSATSGSPPPASAAIRSSCSGVTGGRSIGRMRTAVAPAAIASSRACRRPSLRPPLRCRSGRAPACRASSRTSSSGVTTSVSAIPGVATVAPIVAAARRSARSRRSSASRTAPSRDFAPSRAPTGTIATTRGAVIVAHRPGTSRSAAPPPPTAPAPRRRS